MATRTKAERGLAIGAVLGGVTAGLGFGALSSGLCDAADCDGSFLGGESRRSTYGLRTRDGSFVETTDVRELDISGVRIVAARLLGADPGSAEGRHATGYLLGAVGVLPTWERTTTFFRQEDGGVEESSYASFVPAPGGGVGVGFLIPIGDRWALDLGARGDVIVGIGSEGVVPMAQVTAGLHRGR